MTPVSSAVAREALELRARQSLGTSDDGIYLMVERALAVHAPASGRLVDVGCGSGSLWRVVGERFAAYCGLDAVFYENFPADADFKAVDLDNAEWPLAAAAADVVTAVETIEHLENPWAFMRRLARLARPGGLVIVTTPNQLSALSQLTLLVKQRFSAFQDAHFPAHRTSLLECDLRRAAEESGLQVIEVAYSLRGRIPLTAAHYPRWLAARLPRLLSDNLMLVARKPHD